MKRITLEIPDGYDDLLTVTSIGTWGTQTNVQLNAINIIGHDGDTFIISDEGSSHWKGDDTNSSREKL